MTSGYTGGHISHPTYSQVCTGLTGHAEAVEVKYDPEEVSYDQLLDVFWKVHNPTVPVMFRGGQYRSAIFYKTPEQKQAAFASKAKLERELRRPVTTQITEADIFWPAEEYHQNYYEKHGMAPCAVGD